MCTCLPGFVGFSELRDVFPFPGPGFWLPLSPGFVESLSSGRSSNCSISERPVEVMIQLTWGTQCWQWLVFSQGSDLWSRSLIINHAV